MKRRHSWRQLIPVLCATVVGVSLVAVNGEAGADHVPGEGDWDCEGDVLVMRDGALGRLGLDDGAYIDTATIDGDAFANSLAFDADERWLRGVVRESGQPAVVTYAADGSVVHEAQIGGDYPPAADQFAGTALDDGRLVIHSVGRRDGSGWFEGSQHHLWELDPDTGDTSHIGAVPVRLSDLAENPSDGMLYHARFGRVYRIDPSDGSTTSQSVADADGFPQSDFGGSWFESPDQLVLVQNSPGNLWRVDVSTGAWTDLGPSEEVDQSDATICGTTGSVDEAPGNPTSSLPQTSIAPPASSTPETSDTATPETTGPDTTGPDTTDPDSSGSESTGPDSTGSDTTGPDSTGPDSTGSDTTGPDTTGSDTTGPDTTGPDSTGPDSSGSDSNGSDTTGPDSTGPDSSGSDTTGSDGSTTTEGSGTVPAPTTAGTGPDTSDSDTSDGSDGSTTTSAPGTVPPPASTTTVGSGSTDSSSTTTPDGSSPGSTGPDSSSPGPTPSTVSPERETGTIEIIKTTTGPEGSSVDLGGRFSFLVSCSGGFRQTVTVDVPSATGSSTGSTSLGAMDEGVECYVSEQAPGPDWTIVESSEGPLTVRSGEITEASFTNERRTGSIEIIKTLLGVPESADLSAEQFTAEVVCFGDFVGTSMVESDVAFSVDAPALIDGLPIGAICRVTEDPDRRFTSTYSPTTSGSAAEVTIAAPTAYPVVIANATGSIIISKQTVVTDSSIDPTGDFRFEVDCGAAYTGTVVVSADEPTPNGAQGSLSYDELPLLPDGTQCTVTELAAPAGWTLDTPNGVNVVVSSFMAPTATFTNSRDVGSVVITKSVSGLPDDLDLGDETFDVDITCTGGFVGSELTIVGEQVSPVEPLTVEDIPIGSICEVSEQDDLRFETRYQPSATSGDAARVYVDGAGVAVEITNIAGRLEIEKTTSAISDLDLDVGGEFDFSVSCDNGFSTSVAIEVPTANERSTARVEYPTLPIMRPGTLCWVTEQFPGPEWLQTGAAATPVVIPDGSVVVASFTNQRRTGELRVTKRLGGVPAGDDANDDAFIVDVNCTGDLVDGSVSFDDRSVSVAEPLSITGIPVGSVCRVVEASDDRFAVTYSPADAAGTAGEIEIGPGVATISLANTTGRLSITKRTLSPVGIPVDISGDFSFAISCNNGYRDEVAVSVPDGGSSASATVAHPEIALLRPGTECFVAELFPGSEWEIGETVEFPVTIPESGVVDVVFENTRKTADLTIDLRFVGLPAGAELSDEVFDLNVECTGDFDVSPITFSGIEVSGTEVATLENLPVGSTCVVDGLDDERFDTTWSPAGGGGASILIGPDGARVQVTNTVGSIQITKTVVGSPDWPVDLSGRFTFDVTCDNGYVGVHSVDIDGSEGGANASERLVHPELPLVAPGTQCSVEERDPGVKWIRAVEGPMVRTVPSGGVVNFSLTNSRASGNIRVLKVIEGAPESDLSEEFFDVDLSCEGDFVDGSFTSAEPLAVASGTPLLLNRLPTGARCEIEERHDDLRFEAPAYSASGDGGPGAIVFVVDETKELTITNTATPLADLVVTKTVTGAIGTQFDAEGFGLDVVCTGDFLGGTFRPEGSQSVSVNRPLTIAGIPIGAECKVTEFADSRFTQESVPADGTVTIGADGAELELVNAVLEVAGVEAVNPVNQPAAPTAEPSTPAASAPAGTVAKTGADSRSIAWFGLVLCLSGLLLVAARRRLGHLD